MQDTGPESMKLKTALLTLQPTTACNLRCRYCYLPHDQPTTSMSVETAGRAVDNLADAGLIGSELRVSWHMGEPLLAGRLFFEQAFSAIRRRLGPGVAIRHSIQTNATLLDRDWAAFLRDHDVAVGVSLDGFAALHDANRRFASGRGSFDRALNGIARLHDAGLVPAILCVVTAGTLDYGKELADFFYDHGLRRLSFNPEEIEGENRTTSLATDAAGRAEDFAAFLQEFAQQTDSRGSDMVIRELQEIEDALDDERPRASGTCLPWHHVTVNAQGGLSTFSPELNSMTHPVHGSLILGNVHLDHVRDIRWNDRFLRIWQEIRQGILNCRALCKDFMLCGGGSPSNKLAETGSFLASKTLACELATKASAAVVRFRRSMKIK
ncbi:hypothetical protein C3Y92_16010 [Solidesulfovibrio carbinolicus]|uniref:Radical SAM core domain-containing protein n=2 Tax=Solidesulfovibrio carbinolicus TaxID=296842 RepID=A0A4V0YR58_9BACT|nr:hypothetical protein C3Y92_16010 [Solidesulfovibrio carbinolicus]